MYKQPTERGAKAAGDMTPEWCRNGVTIILQGRDGQRSILDIFQRTVIAPGTHAYKNPFDDFLAHPAYREANEKRVAVLLESSAKEIGEKLSAAPAEALGMAIAETVSWLIGKDVKRNDMDNFPEERHGVFLALSKSLRDRYYGVEPEPYVPSEDAGAVLKELIAPQNGNGSMSREVQKKIRETLSISLMQQADEIEKAKRFTTQDLNRAITKIDNAKEALGRRKVKEFMTMLNGLRPTPPNEEEEAVKPEQFAEKLREIARLVVED